MNTNELRATDRHCIFRAAGATFAVSALTVCEIAERPALVAVPGASSALAGMCHFRNEFLPVLDLEHFVGSLSSSKPEDEFILVLAGHEGNWALLIERGLALEPLEIAYATDGGASQLLIGTASYREEVVQILDADMLYHRSIAMLEERWQQTGCETTQAVSTG